MKDWTGNSIAYSKTMGASNHASHERPGLDYYATEPKAVRLLLEMETFSGTIWECACGEGHLSEEMLRLGYDVTSSDKVWRGYGLQYDFLHFEKNENNKTVIESEYNIITNPPYRYANQFILKALEILGRGKKCAFFMPIRYLEGKQRKAIFEKYPPKTVYVSSSRLNCAINGEFSKKKTSPVCYAWFVWEKGFEGTTELKWFN